MSFKPYVQAGILATAVVGVAALSYQIYVEMQKRGDSTPGLSCSTSTPTSTTVPATTAPAPAPRTFPLTILYATTTGAARRFALSLQRTLFSLRPSGFTFEVTVEDLAGYNVERLEEESQHPRALILFMPTWTGGVPPATGAPLHTHLLELSADFRTPRNALGCLHTAVFGLGNSDYGTDWCRAARECEEALVSLGASSLAPLEAGDDGRDMEGAYRVWAEGVLLPALCELYAKECGVEEQQLVAGGGGGAGGAASSGGGCGTSQNGGGCGSSATAGAGEGSKSKEFLPRKVWRREKRAAKEAAEVSREIRARKEAAAAAAAAAGGGRVAAPPSTGAENPGCCGGSSGDQQGSGGGGGGGCCKSGADGGGGGGGKEGEGKRGEAELEGEEEEEDEWCDEEDAINARLIAEEPAPVSSSSKKAAGVGRRGKKRGVLASAAVVEAKEKKEGEGGEGGDGSDSDAADDDDDDDDAAAAAGGSQGSGGEGENLLDVEDVGGVIAKAQAAAASEAAGLASGAAPREMVTPAQRRALTKEGYKIIGTHSAVKMCRWTKAQLRGRGGCYKHTFYGINSYQCMEATPSLACANKCTFCWRHHKNPVGREWRWKVDAPEAIVEGAIAKHVAMVREFGGTPGVVQSRWEAGLTPAHCALSLVGEPIMYPHINALLRLLHARRISTFLVTNAQFPDAIAALEPVTQLYVSIDAGNEADLREVDRPLFADFWHRFLACLDALRAKRQRTVYRLTLIKGPGGNMDRPEAVEEYADLVARGAPELIEVKGVTWSGVSDGGGLTMASVPWHAEVREFCVKLQAALGKRAAAVAVAGAGAAAAANTPSATSPSSAASPTPPSLPVPLYGLAAEHAHSCCVLMAQEKYKRVGPNGGDKVWHTHINYEKFQELVGAWYVGGKAFGSEDFCAPTPPWAVWGAKEEGFSPAEERGRRGGKAPKPAAVAAPTQAIEV